MKKHANSVNDNVLLLLFIAMSILISQVALGSDCLEISERQGFWNKPLFGAEKTYFHIALEANKKSCFEKYLDLYPDGDFSQITKSILRDISQKVMQYPKDINSGYSQVFYIPGNLFVRDKFSPFVETMPDEIRRRNIGGGLTTPSTLKGVVQKIRTKIAGTTNIPPGEHILGQSLQTIINIDNATDNTITAYLTLYANKHEAKVRIAPKSYYQFKVNADTNPDIINIKLKSNKKTEEVSFMVKSSEFEEAMYLGDYVYNCDNANSYTIISQSYNWK